MSVFLVKLLKQNVLTLCNISYFLYVLTVYTDKIVISFYQTIIWGIMGRNGDYISLKLSINLLLSPKNQVKSGVIITDIYQRSLIKKVTRSSVHVSCRV